MRKQWKGILYGACITSLIGMTTGCGASATGSSSSNGSQGQDGKEVNIAVVVPLTGPNADAGTQSANAAKLAAEDINKAGGIKSLGGAKINLIVTDSTGQPNDAATVTDKILSGNKVSALFGMDLSPLTVAAMPVMARHHVPMVTASISESITAAKNPYVFEIAPKASKFSEAQINFLKMLNDKYHMGIKKAALLYTNDPYGTSTAKSTKKLLTKAGLDVVLDSAYPPSITDATPLISKVKESGAQVLFPVSYVPDAEAILSAIASQNLHILTIGGGAGFIWPTIEKAIGSKVNGLTSVASWNWDSKNITQNTDLVKATEEYKQKYGTYMPEHAGEAYAAIYTIADAIDQAKSADPQKVRDELAKIDVTTGGATLMQPGKVQFDNTGYNAPTNAVMIQWQDNVPKTVFPLDQAATKLQKP
ncbi:ABC transporter substrate-binding protein [Fodinisporobacter ferrooxydans]|uniref:ABC transporter substrate-binding protein n=1 Tax=Fodinisporobacter ferrooxydans TaxID=2901836 RepID=A0ABY4CKZ3_9BACL|nr:ABC transporter substrate-binding protein [Alicyclobacillaceae bacterium MYW30-H2]